MAVYMIAEMDVTDPAAYEAYKAAASDIITRYGGRYVARGGRAFSLEGSEPKRVVVVEFPDLETAQRWYGSHDYAKARALRKDAARGRLYVVEGL